MKWAKFLENLEIKEQPEAIHIGKEKHAGN